MTPQEARDKKIIVALFCVLGKAVNQLNVRQREQLSVTETEIRDAWTQQKSPVRLVSEVPAWSQQFEGECMRHGERVYKVVMGELDLRKTGMDLSGKMPEEPKKVDALKPGRRVFDLE